MVKQKYSTKHFSILNKARCMLRESNQPSKFWADAISYASYLANKSPNSALNGTIPFELWTGEQVDLFHLKVFGCKALAHVPRIQRSKMAPTSKPCVMLDYATNQKGYRLWRLKLQKVIVIRDAVFFESVYPFNKDANTVYLPSIQGECSNLPLSDSNIQDSTKKKSQIRILLPSKTCLPIKMRNFLKQMSIKVLI